MSQCHTGSQWKLWRKKTASFLPKTQINRLWLPTLNQVKHGTQKIAASAAPKSYSQLQHFRSPPWKFAELPRPRVGLGHVGTAWWIQIPKKIRMIFTTKTQEFPCIKFIICIDSYVLYLFKVLLLLHVCFWISKTTPAPGMGHWLVFTILFLPWACQRKLPRSWLAPFSRQDRSQGPRRFIKIC